MRYLLRLILLLPLLISYLTSGAQSNEGTEFWFGFMEHHDERINNKVVMITSKTNTSGVVTVPGLTFSQAFTVAAGEVEIITLPTETETFGSHVITNNSVKVESNLPISVYIHQYYANHAEATLVLPVSTIGSKYYTLSYNGYFIKNRHWPSQFLIVASQDDTTIKGTLSSDSENGGNAGSTFDVTLDAGETYQVLGRNPDDDLSGSYLTSDKNFSVFCGSKYTALSCLRGGRDNLLEQAFPIETWGDRFVSAPFQEGIEDIFRILASENNTTIEILNNDGTTVNYNLDAGEIVEYNSRKYAYITTSKPALIAQYINQLDCGNGETGDPSMIYLNSVLQIKDTVTLYNSPFELIIDNFINVIGRTDDQDNIQFDGAPIAGQAINSATVGVNNEYISFTLKTNAGSHTITSSGCGVIAKAFGLGTYESYAYSGGASFNRINASPIPDGGCLNDTVFFDSGLPEKRFDVEWIFGSGEIVTSHSFEKIYDALGSYPVTLKIYDRCFDLLEEQDKVLEISLRQSVDAIPVDIFCEGDEVIFSATDVSGASYEWIGPNDYFAEEKEPKISNLSTNQTGAYQVIGIVSGCATFPAEVNLEVVANPIPELGADKVFCPKSDIPTILFPGRFDNYAWSDGSADTTFLVRNQGEVIVNVTDINGCIGSDSISLIQQCPTAIYIPNVFSPDSRNGDMNESFGVLGEDIISLELMVFDRWGNRLFSTTDENILWDGSSNGKAVSQGNYSWILNLEGYEEDGSTFKKTMKGSIFLIR